MKKIRMFSIIAMVLILAFVGALPVSAAQTSGTCGENMTWTFDEATGTLTITGQGKMNAGTYPGWYDLRNNTTKIVIGEGVTSISHGAFSGFNTVVSVSLPSSLRTIEANAFSNCYAISSIPLENVTSIGDYAFKGCGSLRELTIPAGVKTISYGAFSNCHGLTKVTFHNALTEIGSYAFSGCSSLTAVTIPDSVKTIGGSAFSHCDSLSSVSLGSGLTSLGDNAFSSCYSLQKIKIPDGVTKIKTNTFNSCTSLQEVQIGAGVSEITVTAFTGCSSLKAFTLSSANASFSVDKGVLYNKSKTVLFLMPEGFSGGYTVLSGTRKIGDYSCYRVDGMTSITIPGSVETIGEYAFDDCTGLNSIKLSNGLTTIGLYAFTRAGFREIVIPETVTKIGELAFFGCSNLKKIVFTGNAPQIASTAFTNLTVDVYYPGAKPGWRDATKLYGGSPHWISTSCESHQPITDPAIEPTCTESGLTEGSHCGVCSAVIVEQEIIPAKGHSYGEWKKKDDDNHESTCTVCLQKEIKPHAWDEGTVTKQPNCLENGELQYTCTDCHATKTLTTEKTTTHNYSPWTMLDEVSHKHVCADCAKEETQTHLWDDGVDTKKATCIAEGLRTYSCTVCAATKSETIAPLTTHTYDHSCDTDCNFCYATRAITHSYSETYSNSKDGHWLQCQVCGMKKDFAEHIPGSAPTEETPQLCTVCEYMLQPSLNHTHHYAQLWTTDEQAHWHVCDGCEDYGAYEAHSFSNDCDTLCDTCGYIRETNHSYGAEWECDEAGHWHSCTVCGAQDDAENHISAAETAAESAKLCQVCGYELAPAQPAQTEPIEISPQPKETSNADGIVVLAAGAVGLICAAALIWIKAKKH